jgi:hypothetical protein
MMGGGMGAMMAEMEAHMAAMAGIHAYNPSGLLEQRVDLGLAAGQVTQLEALVRSVADAKAQAKAQHDGRHAELVTEFEKDAPDPVKVEQLARGAMTAKAVGHGAELAAAASAKALLTPAQREQVEASLKAHGQHQGGEHRGGQQHQQH